MLETREDIAEPCNTDANTNSEAYCPHYERDTCLIHFECCDEEVWYPCHKCHNEKVQENNKPSMDRNSTASNISEGRKILEVGGLNQPGGSSETEGETSSEETEAHDDENEEIDITPDSSSSGMETKHSMAAEISSEAEGLQDVTSTSDEVEEAEHVAGGSSDEPSKNEDANMYNSGNSGFGRIEENASQLAVDARQASPAENKMTHPVATALDGKRLKCTSCKAEQKFSEKCLTQSCGKSFASYVCVECKLVIESKVEPYHCLDCGICRGGKDDHFHCPVCNVCMSLSLKNNHTCFVNRGYDLCSICFEEVFTGAVIFPCVHMFHMDCAEKLVLSGSNVCPVCRNVIFQDDEDAMTSEETTQPVSSRLEIVSRFFCQIGQKISGIQNFFSTWRKGSTRNESSERDIGMANLSTPENSHS